MKDKKKYVIPALLVLCVVASAGYLIYHSMEREIARKEYNALRDQVMLSLDETETEGKAEDGTASNGTQNTTDPEGTDAEKTAFEPLVLDYDKLNEMNDSFTGWISIPALDLNYPIAKAWDNGYYLTHSFEKKHLVSGSIFMDCGASSDWSDSNTFVFGHNMKDETMFGKLKYYLGEESPCEENPYFYIYTEEEIRIYEIFACYEAPSSSDQFRISLTDEDYDAYVATAMELSTYQSDVNLSERPPIVTLSTCYGNNGTKQRVLVHGVLVGTEQTQNR